MSDDSDHESADESRRAQLVAFDEALRLGRPHESKPTDDPALQETQEFLVFLQSVWQRKAKTIGPYTLLSTLGSGSVGPSYLVEDPQTKKCYVLRVLWPDLNAHATVRQQILAEAKASQLLRHANILPIRQARVMGSVCMFISTHNVGPSLEQWRGKHAKPLPWEVCVSLIANLADIVENAHSQGFTHGNLKPSNIFLATDKDVAPESLHLTEIRIGEFGLSRAVLQSRLMAQNSLPWPMPHYLAPEQLTRRERAADMASDYYALGVLLYELLTSNRATKGTTREEIFAQTRDGTPRPPRQICPAIPEDVNDLVMKCLAKQPHQRHASAKQLADACRATLPGAVEPKATPSWWRRWLPWPR